jgi:outer membrane protein assembly factor BamB
MRRLVISSYVLALAGLLIVTRSSPAADWPQWRGPERNGIAPKSPALANSVAGLLPLWLADGIPSGDQGGRGGLIVHAGQVYGLAKAPADEVFCLDALTGKTKWRSKLKDTGRGEGGSSTPCIVKDKLYVVGSGSTVSCLNVNSGSLIWEAKLSRTGKEPIASSIAVVGNVAVLLADVLTALDAETGKLLWTQNQIKGFESSPATWSCKGHDYVLCNDERKTYCVDAADGRIAWSVPGGSKSTPVVALEYGGDFLVNMTENRKPGLTAYRLSETEPKQLWALPFGDRGSSPLVFDGHVYVIAGGEFHGYSAHLLNVHLDTGKVAWDEVVDFGEVSSPVVADGKVFVVLGTYLGLLQATPEKYSLLSLADYRIMICTSPTIVEGRLYVRQANAVACYDLRAAP